MRLEPIRIRRLTVTSWIAGLAVMVPLAQQQAPTASLAITRITVIDTAAGSARADMTVVIGGNHIVELGDSDAVVLQKDVPVVDGRGKFLLPGLWDMHVHLFNNIDPPGTNYSHYMFPLLGANGVVGVRDMWTDPEDIAVARQWNRDIDAGTLVGPRVIVTSRIVDGEPPDTSQFACGPHP